jgi:hypothetical protein
MRSTHTLATMDVSAACFREIMGKLQAAGYDHAVLGPDQGASGMTLDMSGIMLAVEHLPTPRIDNPPPHAMRPLAPGVSCRCWRSMRQDDGIILCCTPAPALPPGALGEGRTADTTASAENPAA